MGSEEYLHESQSHDKCSYLGLKGNKDTIVKEMFFFYCPLWPWLLWGRVAK